MAVRKHISVYFFFDFIDLNYRYNNKMEEVLMALKTLMIQNKKLPQPQDGLMY